MVQNKSSGLGHGHSNLADSAYLSKHSGTAWNGLRFFYFPSEDIPGGTCGTRRPGPRAASRRRPEAGLGPRPPLSCATARRGRPEAYPKVRPHPKKVTPHPRTP